MIKKMVFFKPIKPRFWFMNFSVIVNILLVALFFAGGCARNADTREIAQPGSIATIEEPEEAINEGTPIADSMSSIESSESAAPETVEAEEPELLLSTEELKEGTLAEDKGSASQEKQVQPEFSETIKEKYAEQKFPGIPGVCSSIEECRSICTTNMQVCQQYCMNNPTDELCLAKHEVSSQQTVLPGRCINYTDCGVYCKEHPTDPDCAVGKVYAPVIALPNITMPFRPDEYSPREWGLWPFCVHGGDHPEGHGGIDFELKPGTRIYSGVNGTVEMVEEISKDSPDEGGGLAINTGKVAIAYYGIVNHQVKVGDAVVIGQYIGDAVRLPRGEYFIHFEVNNFVDAKLECPVPYLDDNFIANLKEMLKQSHYPEKSAEPNLCNCEWLPYKKTMTRKD